MDRATEERWRAILKEKGMEAVRVELDMQPGNPSDVWHIGDRPPYPTRAYLEDWCRGKPVKPFGFSGSTTMVIAMSLIFVVCIIRAISSFSPSEKNWLSDGSVPYMREAVPTMRGAAAQSSDAILNGQMITDGEQHTDRAACSAVSSAGDLRTVQTLAACSKLGSTVGPAKTQ